MEKVYQYYRIKKQNIDKTSSNIDIKIIFSDINSTATVSNFSNDEIDKEE